MSYRAVAMTCIAAAVLCGVPQITSAQSDAATFTAQGEKEPTNIRGVEIFADRPAGFNPLQATDAELATYGLPHRPDQDAEPAAYARWARAMTAMRSRPSAHLEAKPFSSTNMMAARQAGSAAVSATPLQIAASNWSGVADTNSLKAWNATTSFDVAVEAWAVPAAQPPFGACANGITGPFYEVTWPGIDGFKNGDVVQGGSFSAADCVGDQLETGEYFGWIEWYPSYSILAINAPVDPGDIMLVEVEAAKGTAEQFVFIEDLTQGWAGTYGLTYVTGPGVVGNSLEWIVERPGTSSGFTALANYIGEFPTDDYGFDPHGTQFDSGSQTLTTYVISMLNDAGNQDISAVIQQGSTGGAGKFNLSLASEGCAYSGGCTP